MKAPSSPVILAGLLGLVLVSWPRSASGAIAPSSPTGAGGPTLTGRAGDVFELAARTVEEHALRADPRMLTTIAATESDFRSGVIGDGGRALGIMQVLESTGRWLSGEMGYSAFGAPVDRGLMLADNVSVYLGAAYLDWLQAVEPDRTADPAYMVRAYNGGRRPDGTEARRAATLAYLDRFRGKAAGLFGTAYANLFSAASLA